MEVGTEVDAGAIKEDARDGGIGEGAAAEARVFAGGEPLEEGGLGQAHHQKRHGQEGRPEDVG